MKFALWSQPTTALVADVTIGPEGDSINVGSDTDRTECGADPTPDAHELVLVGIAPDEDVDRAEQLLRAAHRFAKALCADWTVVCVETPTFLGTPRPQKDLRIELSRLAESLGAATATLVAASPPEALQEYSRLRGARTILVGASRRRIGWRLLRRSMAATLARSGMDADLIVIPREGADISDGREATERAFGRDVKASLWRCPGALVRSCSSADFALLRRVCLAISRTGRQGCRHVTRHGPSVVMIRVQP